MAGQVRVTFQAGERITTPEFREKLMAVASQAADGVSWTWGPGLVGNYSPGSGFTLGLDASVLPEIRRESFTAIITGHSGLAHAWTERARKDETTWEDKADSPRSGTTSDQAAYEINGKVCRTGQQVVMWRVVDTSGTVRYEFSLSAGSDFVLAKITAYSGSTYSWEEVDSDGLTVTGGMTGANNLKEINGRQGIPSGTVVMIWPGEADDEWWMDQAEGKDTSAEVIPDPTGEVPEDSSWDRESQGSSRGVSVGVVAQVYYNETSGQLVYRMRTLTFDSSGRLTKVSLLSIDKDITTAEDCPAPE